jgi:large subunit ribosomal protein L25
MADFYKLELELREANGTQAAKAIRKNGKVPANYYFHGEKNVDVMLDSKTLMRALHSGSHIFETHLNDDRQFVMVKEIQFHPVTDEVIHVDFMRVRRTEKASFTIHIELQGVSEGVLHGGLLSQNINMLDISCFPTDVPEFIAVDITNVELSQNLYVSDIIVSDDVEILTPGETMLLSVQPPKAEVEAVEVDEEVDDIEESSEETKSEE